MHEIREIDLCRNKVITCIMVDLYSDNMDEKILTDGKYIAIYYTSA